MEKIAFRTIQYCIVPEASSVSVSRVGPAFNFQKILRKIEMAKFIFGDNLYPEEQHTVG